jgi:[ribosomal protein S5]-alanine N-acetyltransferase
MPGLETSRLVLREMTLADAPALEAIWGDAETMRWYPRALTQDEIEGWIGRQMSRYPSGTGLLGMVLKETGELIGDCGPTWQEVDGATELEIGYHVHRAHQGRGYATEAAQRARDYAFGTLGRESVISLIRPENLPSRRVAEKNGMMLERVVFWRGYDTCVYRLARGAAR